MAETIHVLMITQKNGHLLSAHSTDCDANNALDRYVSKYWVDQFGSKESMPESPEARIEEYFFDNELEFYDIAELEVDKED